MRSAETCLAIIRTRGERRLPIDDLYRQLFNPEFYLQAYGKISRNRRCDDSRSHIGNRGRHVAGEDSAPSSRRCASSGIAGRLCDGCYIPEDGRDARCARRCPRGPTSCCRK